MSDRADLSGSTVGRRLGAFVAELRDAPIPAEVEEKLRCNLMHNFSCAMAAHTTGQVLWDLVRDRRPAEATVFCDGTEVDAGEAAFANGSLMHTRAQDDTHFTAKTHVGSTITPAALALAEATGADGDAFMRAVIAGCEVAASVGELMARESTARGFRASPLYGTLGAAAASAVVLGLDAERATSAIAIAASFSAGLNQTWIDGTGEYRIQMGAAAMNGIRAARLARAGVEGAPSWFEGDAGFARSFVGEVEPPEDWELGRRWRIMDVTYKPFPVCAITQSLVQVSAELSTEHDLDPGSIEGVKVYLNPEDRSYPGTVNPGPYGDVASTLMSAEYCAAMALKERTATLEGLTHTDDPDLLRLVSLTEVIGDDSMPSLSGGIELEVGGETLSRRLIPDDSTYIWDWDGVVANALRMAAEIRGGEAAVRHLADVVGSVATLDSVEPLAKATVT